MTIFDRLLEAQQLLGKNREAALSPEEKKRYQLAMDALWFVWSNGQAYAFEDYLKDSEAQAPHRVIAAFNTRDEADAWLKTQSRPPDLALVLIGDAYHIVLSSKDGARCALVPDSDMEYHLEELMKAGVPAPEATFPTREEAMAWFNRQTEPAAQTVLQIAGANYLAVYYRNLQHRALFPFTLVERLHERRRRREREGQGE
ncbi:head protein [Archangium primigenium]|uniref:head protein n=1 Tax=[Archangium] primigenium TaxID=2792470 RepID=UPI00195C124F|nr:head protein [Archangium primigenium]MBM7118239.1 head protein [Archangium primigenium]